VPVGEIATLEARVEARVARTLAERRPDLERLVRDLVDAELDRLLAELVDEELAQRTNGDGHRDRDRGVGVGVGVGERPAAAERPVRVCARCGQAPALHHQTVCKACKLARDNESRRRRKATRPRGPKTAAAGETEAQAHVLATFGQFERRLIGQRTKEALAAKKAVGVRLGRPPNVPQPVVRRIQRQRARGDSFRKIAEDLNEASVPTAQGGKEWYAATVRHVLVRTL
jgi:Recombinase